MRSYVSLLDDLASPPAKASGFLDWLAQADKPLKAALEKAAVDPRWSDHGLEQTLRKRGVPCSKESIVRWRASLGYTG